jgi:hypothetical protein
MIYRVILERDGIYRSANCGEWIGLVKPERGDQVFDVEASSSTEAIAKAGQLWKLPEGDDMAKKKKKKKRKKVATGY